MQSLPPGRDFGEATAELGGLDALRRANRHAWLHHPQPHPAAHAGLTCAFRGDAGARARAKGDAAGAP